MARDVEIVLEKRDVVPFRMMVKRNDSPQRDDSQPLLN